VIESGISTFSKEEQLKKQHLPIKVNDFDNFTFLSEIQKAKHPKLNCLTEAGISIVSKVEHL
jgi:hypothetical protein